MSVLIVIAVSFVGGTLSGCFIHRERVLNWYCKDKLGFEKAMCEELIRRQKSNR